EPRLRFLSTLARLWNIATRCFRAAGPDDKTRATIAAWLEQALANRRRLLELLHGVYEHEIPRPATGSFDSMIGFDRRNVMKHRRLSRGMATAPDQQLAAGALRSLGGAQEEAPELPWEPGVLGLERALFARDRWRAEAAVREFIAAFRSERLLYTPLEHG